MRGNGFIEKTLHSDFRITFYMAWYRFEKILIFFLMFLSYLYFAFILRDKYECHVNHS